jgi:uncharacterized iron-regulated membrane protein
MSWNAFRKGLQLVHLWAGLILAIPFILIGLTGSIIIATNVVRDYSAPAAPARGEIQSMTRILAAAQQAAPEGWPVATISMPEKMGQPAAIQVALPPGRRPQQGVNFVGLTIYVDPVSLKILGSEERRRAGAFNRNLTTMHVALMAPGYYGLQTVGFLGIALVLFGLSGLTLWWPRKHQWRSAFGVKRGARGFRLNRDLHGAVGFWSLIVFLIISLSGVDLAFPVTFQSVVGQVLPLKTGVTSAAVDPAVAATIRDKNALTPDEAARVALSSIPNSRLLQVQLPPRPDGVYMVTLIPRPFDDGAPQISTFIGPGPEILDLVDPRTYSIGKRFLVWLRVMHYGQGLGEVWRILAFFSGFLPLLFAITGFQMWWLKRSQRSALPAAALAQPAE